jgi:hypothetical protein
LRKLLRATVVASATALTLVASEMAFASASAFASAPEIPVTLAATSITADSAILHGTLNPHSTTKVGGYFAYSNPEGSSCTEGPTAGLEEFEGEKEEEAIAVHTTVGLEPHRKYKACVVATNELNESTLGLSNEVTVKTLSPPPEVVNESAPPLVTTTETTLEAAVTANNQATECHFQYGTTIVTEHEVPCNEATIEHLEQGVSSGVITGLELERTYKYRVILKNIAKHEQAVGPTQEFETVAAPTALVPGIAEEVTGTTANLGGKLNAGGEATYYVEYGTAPCTATECGEKSYTLVASGKIQEDVTPIVVNDLQPLTTYHYWLVAKNDAATVHSEAKEFTTKLAAPSVETGNAEGVTQTSAEITGQLDPGGEAEYYFEYGPTPCSGNSCGAATATAFVSGKTQANVTPIVLSGLQPNTTYYYWLVAKNGAASQPVQGEARRFTTPQSQATVEAEEAAARKPGEERAAASAAQHKREEEAQHGEEAAAAAGALKEQQYNEIAAETVALERHEAEAKRREEPIAAKIAATSVEITKTKLKGDRVSVTIRVSQPGTVTFAGAGLKKAVVKVTAGTRTVEISLTRAGKTARKHHKKVGVSASLTTSLTTVSASATVKL